MNILVHLFYTLIFARMLNLGRLDFFLAVGFGALVDLDHVVPYVKTYLKEKKINQRGYDSRWYTQEPIFFIVVIPISVVYRTWVPIIFFSLHLLLDYMMDYKKYPLYPNKKIVVRGFIKSYGILYWIITAVSVLLFIWFFSIQENLSYLLSLL